MRGSAVFVWTDRALFLGDRSETAVHSHHAIELCLALDERGIDMASPGGPAFHGVPGALVRANAPHRLSIPGPKVAVAYLDPHTPAGQSLHAWLGDAPLAALPDLGVRAALCDLFDGDLSDATPLLDGLLRQLAPDPPRPRVDWRIRKVRALLDTHLDAPPTQAEAAAHVDLSPGRLGHLFKEQVGLPMRRYILWMRLRDALTRALDGTPMTDAAYLAGFSDAAHFTRTCQRMFGLPPTAFAPVDAVFVA